MAEKVLKKINNHKDVNVSSSVLPNLPICAAYIQSRLVSDTKLIRFPKPSEAKRTFQGLGNMSKPPGTDFFIRNTLVGIQQLKIILCF